MDNNLTILVDLNVVLDVLQNRQPFYKHSAHVLNTVANKKVRGLLAGHSITTLFYLIARSQNRQTAVSAIHQLLQSFTVATINDAIIRDALSWGWPDFEDAVQMASATAANADYLITRNPKGFISSPLPVIQPGELAALLI